MVLAANHGVGGLLAAGSDVEGSRVVVRDTRPRASDQAFGRGVESGGRLVLTDAVFAANRDVGLAIFGEASEAEGARVVVRDTRPQASDLAFGRGVGVQLGRLRLTDAVVAGNREVGLFVNHAASVEGSRVVVRGTQQQASDQTAGNGVVAQHGRLVLSNAVVADNWESAVALEGTWATVHQVAISGTRADERGVGDGVFSADDSLLEATAFVVRDNARAGLVTSGSRVRLSGGLVTGNAVGLVRRQESEVTQDDVVIEGNDEDEPVCDQVCVDDYVSPEEAAALEPISPLE